MLSRLSSKVVATATAAVLIGGSTFLVAGSASAVDLPDGVEPGDSATVGAAAQSQLTIGDIVNITQQSAYGVLGAHVPGEDSDTQTDAVLLSTPLIPSLASLQAGVVQTNVKSAADQSTALSVVNDTDLTLFGFDVLGLGVASAAAVCPVVGDATAGVVTEGLTVFGIPVTLDADNSQYQASRPLGTAVQVRPDTNGDLSDDIEDLSGVTLTVRIAQVAGADEVAAASIALALQVSLSGTFDGVDIPFSSTASIVLADAACFTPLSLATITPTSGATAGGETVTLTGTGIPSDATVAFGGVPATNVVIADDGRSLTATAPAHEAGAVDVTVTTAGGQTVSLPYTYVAPVVPVTPASSGTTTLAATGADPAQGLGLGAGVLALGLGALVAAAAVRRRRA